VPTVVRADLCVHVGIDLCLDVAEAGARAIVDFAPLHDTGGAAPVLLHNVGKLVRQQQAACAGRRRVLAASEDNMFPNRVGAGLHAFGGLGGLTITVYTNTREIMAEPRPEERRAIALKGSPGRAQHLMDYARRPADHAVRQAGPLALQWLPLFLCAVRAFAAEPYRHARGLKRTHLHNLCSGAIRFMLKRIVCLPDNELSLHDVREWSCSKPG
jgi:hypothetical protein